jgi:hypothetical protein
MARIKHIGGETVPRGNYWNFSNGDRISMDSDGVLPGGANATYYKASPLVVLAMGPVLGLIYAAFLPFIGIAIITKIILTKLFGRTLEGLSSVSTFNWSPSEAYLAGRQHKKEAKENTTRLDAGKSKTDKQ